MLRLLIPWQQVIRRSSSKVPADEFEQALSWLVETASTRAISPEESKVFHHERPWAIAPIVIAHGRTTQSNVKADGLIRWLHHPKRC
ncbi:hypothetical protein Y032_0065g3587 [Ancylostoma ceylanicum]|nr:hypothetical protein Y032_0065g3587 [Ancylostoma ceylanicum]